MTVPIAAEAAASAWPAQVAADVFGASDVAWLGGIVQSVAFVDSFEVLRTAMTPDQWGGQTPGAVTVVATGACLLKPTLSQAEALAAQRLNVTRPAVIILPAGVDVLESDQVRINGTRTFEVSEVALGGRLALFTACLCSEVL